MLFLLQKQCGCIRDVALITLQGGADVATILKYSGEQKADSRSPDKANATTSVIYPLPPQMAHNLTQSEPSGLKMGIRRDNILAPKDDPPQPGFGVIVSPKISPLHTL